MSIFLKKIQRINPNDRDAPRKWYPSVATVRQLDETEVADAIADETTLNPGEALMAVRQLRKVVLHALLSGYSVRLGNWGSFYAVAETTPAETKEALTALNVSRVRIVFRPGKEVKDALLKATFAWTEELDKIHAATTDPDEEGEETESPGTI